MTDLLGNSSPDHCESGGDEPIRVAVYGTLMQGQGGQDLAGIKEGMTCVGPCQIRGDLYDLGEYPGLLDGEGLVKGQVFVLRDASILQKLDLYEGYFPGNPAASLFVRRFMPVEGMEGHCWIYYYNESAPSDSLVPSGDWAAHVRCRTGLT